ncbi:Cytochrome P450 20A1 [Lamellibrachia satsuma]|nr:Cytochrome P450 20A1 [Lamellibrachia satsuma]
MLPFVVYVGVVVLCAVIAVLYLYPGSKKVTTVPGLDASDEFEGNLPDIQKAGSLHEFLTVLHKNYGDIASFWFGHQLTVSIASPQLFKEHAKPFDRPPILFQMFEPFIGSNSIQYCNGEEGRNRYVMYARCFSDQAMSIYYDTIEKLADGLVQKWRNIPGEEHIGLWEQMAAMGIKAMLQCSFGKYFNDDTAVNNMRRSYDVVMADMARRLDGSVPEEGSVREQMFRKQKDIIREILNDAMENFKNNPPSDVRMPLIDVLHRSDMPDTTVSDDMLTVFVAGFHTSALLMTWGLYFLATHPDVQLKLFNEIQQVVGCNEAGEQLKVTPANIDKLVYMRQVLDETLRCSALGTFAARYQDVESELGGHRIPAGTPVVHALGVVLQNHDLYPDPTT